MLVTEKYELKLRSAAAPAVQPSMINAIHLISIREAYRVILWIEICPIKNSVIHLFGTTGAWWYYKTWERMKNIKLRNVRFKLVLKYLIYGLYQRGV